MKKSLIALALFAVASIASAHSPPEVISYDASFKGQAAHHKRLSADIAAIRLMPGEQVPAFALASKQQQVSLSASNRYIGAGSGDIKNHSVIGDAANHYGHHGGGYAGMSYAALDRAARVTVSC